MISDFKGKRVLVMGLGLHGGGVGTVKYLVRSGARVTVTDMRSRTVLAPSLALLKKYSVRYVLGKHREKDFLSADVIVKNPGVPPSSQYLILARRHNIPVTSDIGIFFRHCPARIIGITGTRGKSTTASLIAQFLQKKYPRVFLAGNIRKSVLELLPQLKKDDWVVLELSSFQLEDRAKEKQSPHIAVLTNIYRDHINWHGSYAKYIAAKQMIFRFQKQNDVLFVNRDDGVIARVVRNAPGRVIRVSPDQAYKKIIEEKLGGHYQNSVALAIAVGRYCGVSAPVISRTLQEFRGLEGRQHEVAVKKGIHFINDTTATIPEAVIAALHRFKKMASKIVLIAGGQDKKLNFADLAYAIKKNVSTVILLPGTATEKLKKKLRSVKYPQENIVDVSSMQEAVDTAQNWARRGDYVLLSPGAASFGLFANEFDRGDQFIKAVHHL